MGLQPLNETLWILGPFNMQRLIQFHILLQSFELEKQCAVVELLLMGRIDLSGNDYPFSWLSVAFKVGLSNECM